MGGRTEKTSDGIKLTDVINVALQAGATVRDGSRHIYMLNYNGLRPCPVAESTHAERMVAPWLAQVMNKPKSEAYNAIRRGYL